MLRLNYVVVSLMTLCFTYSLVLSQSDYTKPGNSEEHASENTTNEWSERDLVPTFSTENPIKSEPLTTSSIRTQIGYNVFLQVLPQEESVELTVAKTFEGDPYSFLNRQNALAFLYDLATNCINDDLIAISKQMNYDIPEYQAYALAIFAELPEESLMLYGMDDFREQIRSLDLERQYYMKTADPYIGKLELFVLEGLNGARPEIYTALPASSYEDYTLEPYNLKRFVFSSDTTNPSHWSNLDNYTDLFSLKEYEDDLQVIVFDGPNKAYKPVAEFIWVHALGVSGNYYIGSLLNHPKELKDWENGDLVIFKMDNGEDAKPMIFSPEQLINLEE